MAPFFDEEQGSEMKWSCQTLAACARHFQTAVISIWTTPLFFYMIMCLLFGSGLKTSDRIQGPRFAAGPGFRSLFNSDAQQSQADREHAFRRTFWRMRIDRRPVMLLSVLELAQIPLCGAIRPGRTMGPFAPLN